MVWGRKGSKDRTEGKNASSTTASTTAATNAATTAASTAATTAASTAATTAATTTTATLTTTQHARPSTMTLSTSQVDSPARGPQTRVCFVCGQRFSERSLEIHEKKCIQLWQLQKKALPNTVKCTQPQKLRIPSVDGTKDVGRIDAVAHSSSSQAQRAECTKCRTNLALGEAKQHVENCRGGQRKTVNKKQKSNAWRNKDDALYAIMY
uniref:Zinc finger protein 474 n=1 Tax=Plectus sambesii TaxID=2011161 RepID=A0A914VDD0_9BILA